MKLEGATVQVGTAVTVLIGAGSIAWGAYSWAEDKFKETAEERAELREAVAELKISNALLSQIAKSQQELLKEAAEDAEENSKALLRIETKLETRDLEP